MTLSAEMERRIRSSFARQTMMATMGAGITELGLGTATISAPVLPTSLQQAGAAHAALAFAIGDSAGGYAAISMGEPDGDVVTVEMKINLLRPAVGELLIAEGRVIKPGRKLVVVQSEVFAETGGERKLIAQMLGTMFPIHATQ